MAPTVTKDTAADKLPLADPLKEGLAAAADVAVAVLEKPSPFQVSQPVSMFERLALDPNVDVDKLQRLIDMQERILRHNAESAFNAAFAEMQADLPVIFEKGKTDKGTYAPLEDIIEPVRPVLKKHGFALNHRTEWPEGTRVKVVGTLLHREGHSQSSEFVSIADQSGSKNAIQALASTVSYGRRYTTKDLLCIVTRGEDDDAATSDKSQIPDPPDGLEAWWKVLDGIAASGFKAFDKAWADSKVEFKNYVVKWNQPELKALKIKASKGKP